MELIYCIFKKEWKILSIIPIIKRLKILEILADKIIKSVYILDFYLTWFVINCFKKI